MRSWVVFEVKLADNARVWAWCLHDGINPGFVAVEYTSPSGMGAVDFGAHSQGDDAPSLSGAPMVVVLPAGGEDRIEIVDEPPVPVDARPMPATEFKRVSEQPS